MRLGNEKEVKKIWIKEKKYLDEQMVVINMLNATNLRCAIQNKTSFDWEVYFVMI